MKFNRAFVEELKMKLTYGSSNSILLNALPGRLATRLAVNDLDIIKPETANSFIKNLTTQKRFAQQISINFDKRTDEDKKRIAKIAKRLDTLKFEHDDYQKEHGIETFAFGYPLLVKQNTKNSAKCIIAPLFIFKLQLMPSFKKANEWVISRTEEFEISLNESLYSFLESEEKIKVPALPEEMLEDGILDENEIRSYCSNLLKQLGSEYILPGKLTIEALKEKYQSEEDNIEKGKIVWSGVFGIYKGQKQSIIKEIDFLLDNINHFSNQEENLSLRWDNAHTPMVTDPSQNSVLRSLIQSRNIVIQGPPGTGKSQTLTAIITSALANNKKILVVCEKKTALNVLKEKLTELMPDIAPAIGIIEDLTADRAAIVQSVRNRIAVILRTLHHKQSLQNDINRFEKHAELVESQYKRLNQNVWRDKRWKDMIGLQMNIIKKLKINEHNLNSLQQQMQGNSWTDVSYFKLLDTVEEGEIKYYNIAEDVARFEEILPGSVLLNYTLAKDYILSIKSIADKLAKIIADVELLQVDLLQYCFAEEGKNINYEQNELHKQIESLNFQENELEIFLTRTEKIADLVNDIDISKLNKPSLLIKLFSIFSNQQKQILFEHETEENKFKNLQHVWLQHFKESVLQNDFLNKKNELIQKRNSSLIAKEKAVQLKNLLSSQKNELILNAKDIITSKATIKNSNLTLTENLGQNILDTKKQSIIEALQQCLQAFTTVSDYKDKDSFLKLPINSLPDYLLLHINILDELLTKGDKIDYYFEWKRYLSKLDEQQKETVRCLANTKMNNWKNILDFVWLKLNTSQVYAEDKFPTAQNNLNLLNGLGNDIREKQKNAAIYNISNWYGAGINKLKQSNIEVNQLYNMRGSKGSTRNSLRKIINTNINAFTDFFPVLMLNPVACSSLLPLQKNMFDIVIFDEASQLRIEDTFTSLLRGIQVVVSGDSKQMPPSNYFAGERQFIEDNQDDGDETIEPDLKEMAIKESLLEFCIDSGYMETYLDMHYRSKHPDLIEFSNACFYNNRLIPLPANKNLAEQAPIKYLHVNGLYEKSQNIDEAHAIITILKNEINYNQSVGIATFNIVQRNCILKLIRDERIKDEDFNAKISNLESLPDSLFVKNLENIQGDERDVIIMCTTFGINKNNKFIMGFGGISGKNGHRLLNVIITRAKYKMFVVTSIPENRIAEYADRIDLEKTVSGTAGLLAYLAYAKKVSEKDNVGKEEILQFISSKIGQGQNKLSYNDLALTESPFEEEVYSLLKDALGDERITLQYKCGGFRIDMVVHPKNKSISKKLAIECDGAAYHSSPIAWHNDIYRQEQLEKQDFVFHRIWSTNWWKRPDEEFKSLLEAVKNLG